MNNNLKSSGLFFEERPLLVSSTPYLIDQKMDQKLRVDFKRLHSVIEKVISIVVDDVDLLSFLGVPTACANILNIDSKYKPMAFFCRYDFIMSETGYPQIVELNTSCPGGIIYSRLILDSFKKTERFRQVLSNTPRAVGSFPCQEGPIFTKAITSLYQRISGTKELPNVVLLNSKYKSLTNELDLIVSEMNSCGLQATRCYVEDLQYIKGSVVANGMNVQLAYNKFDPTVSGGYELPFTPTVRGVEPYLSALRAGKLIGVNSMPAMYVSEGKSFLALLKTGRVLAALEPSERELIQRLVPETYVMAKMEQAELERVIREKDQFVLKLSLSTRGRSLLLGHMTSSADWERAVRIAREDKTQTWIIQTYLRPETYVDACNSKHYTTLAYFILDAEPVGLFVRTSTDEVTNVGRSGKLMVPLLV